MSDLRIYTAGGKWRIQDRHGIHPVTFKLGDVSWQLTDLRGGFDVESEDYAFDIEFEVRGNKYRLDAKLDGSFEVYQFKPNDCSKYLDELLLPSGSPFTAFFKKTGLHVLTKKEITIPIYQTFDVQQYGQEQ